VGLTQLRRLFKLATLKHTLLATISRAFSDKGGFKRFASPQTLFASAGLASLRMITEQHTGLGNELAKVTMSAAEEWLR
jgi:hypothetical protein